MYVQMSLFYSLEHIFREHNELVDRQSKLVLDGIEDLVLWEEYWDLSVSNEGSYNLML